ncbi:MAG: stage III sporulation protein AA [Lachnospiraceae bacterium]|nr:stage III sporulation protein AA [Lachnospiraceae bacterium]
MRNKIKKQPVEQILRILPKGIRKAMENANPESDKLEEIRLRIERPVSILYEGQRWMLSKETGLTKESKKALYVKESDLNECIEYVCNYSMYAYEEELKHGFVTIQGGHRIGVAGKIVSEGNKVLYIKNISFLNIRVAHEVFGCGEKVFPHLWEKHHFQNTMIVSEPGAGKTTLLRDLIRLLSDGNGAYTEQEVSLVDERSEVAACYRGVPQNDVGRHTDVMDNCPKAIGMNMMLRSMKPQVLAVDEIGSQSDVEAIKTALHSGVKILMSAHGEDIERFLSKEYVRELGKENAFERIILIEKKREDGDNVTLENNLDDNDVKEGIMLRRYKIYNEKGELLDCLES